MTAFFSILKLLLIVVWSLFCIIIAGLVYLFTFSSRIPIFLAKHLWSKPMLILMGSRIKVSGRENIDSDKNYLIFSNHCSYADIPVLFNSLPLYIRFIGKNELKKIPFLGIYMRISGMIFIDRSKPRKAKASLEDAAKLLHTGKNVVIFPEGTTIEDGKIAPFKRGCHTLATLGEKDILPVRIRGTLSIWPISSNLKMKNGRIQVIIGKAISYEEIKDMKATEFLKKMQNRLEEL